MASAIDAARVEKVAWHRRVIRAEDERRDRDAEDAVNKDQASDRAIQMEE